MNVTNRVYAHLQTAYEGVKYSLSSGLNISGVTIIALISFALFLVSTFPRYAYQLGMAGVGYWDNVLFSLFELTVDEAGWIGIGLTGMYSILIGMLFMVLLGRVRQAENTGIKSLFGIAPGIFAAGCAGCGAGILGLLGITGTFALFPFQGNGIRLVGMLLVVYAIGSLGDPRQCTL